MSQYWISMFLSTLSPPAYIFYLLPYSVAITAVPFQVLYPLPAQAHAFLCTGLAWIFHGSLSVSVRNRSIFSCSLTVSRSSLFSLINPDANTASPMIAKNKIMSIPYLLPAFWFICFCFINFAIVSDRYGLSFFFFSLAFCCFAFQTANFSHPGWQATRRSPVVRSVQL